MDETETTEVPSADPGPIKTVEAWAEAKGYLPQFTGGGLVQASLNVQGPFAQVDGLGNVLRAAARKPNHDYYLSGYAAARGLFAWPIGFEITEADFDAALLTAKHQPI